MIKVYFTAIVYLDFIHCPYVLQPQRFEGWFIPKHQVNLLCWVQSIELAFFGGPSLETLWLQNIRTMDKIQLINHSNRAQASKTFRDEG
jgi:hypothetical protein